MRDRCLVVGAAVCAVCGVATLFVMAQQGEPAQCKITSVSEPGRYVACTGIVYYVREKDGNFTGDISVGDLLYVEGVTTLYNGQLEIIPENYTISKVLYGICSGSKLHTIQGVFHTELDDGIHAVTGVAEGDHLEITDELPLSLFVPFRGRVTSSRKGENPVFTLFGNSHRFISVPPVPIGEVSGFGVQIGEDVIVLYCEWNELVSEPIAEAKARPEGYPVKVCGTVASVRVSDGHLFLVIADSTGCILIPVFKNMQDSLGVDAEHIYVGQTITVVGITAVYKGAPEILPELIV